VEERADSTWAISTTCGGGGVDTNSVGGDVGEEAEEDDEVREDHLSCFVRRGEAMTQPPSEAPSSHRKIMCAQLH
jgi:hypothetical protein